MTFTRCQKIENKICKYEKGDNTMIDKPGEKLQTAVFVINIINIIITIISAIVMYIIVVKNGNNPASVVLATMVIVVCAAISIFIVYMQCLFWSAIGEINRKTNIMAELQGYELYLKIKDDPTLQAELQNSYKVSSVLSTIIDE